MSTFKEITDLVSKVKNEISVKEDDYAGIAEKAKDSIAYFPVIVPDTLDLEIATKITRALERVYGNFLVTSMSLRNITQEDDVNEFIKKFHQNRDGGAFVENVELKDVIEEAVLNLCETVEKETPKNLKNVLKEATQTVEVFGESLVEIEERNSSAVNKTSRLSKRDISKYNDMTPTMFEVTLYVKTEGGLFDITFDMGVKTIMHTVSDNEIIEQMASGAERKRKFFNFIKATTGEIKFFKDYLFMVDNAKKDAVESNKKNGGQWAWLRTDKLLSKFKKFLKGKPLLPITTVVMTQEQVDTISNEFNVDYEVDSNIKQVMDYYHLLGVVVVDPEREFVKAYYDGRSGCEEYTFKSLERENRKGNDFGKLTALLSKGGVY